MARIVGVDIPNNKRLDIALTYIYGVGKTRALEVCKNLNLDPAMKARDLNEEQTTEIANHLTKGRIVCRGERRRRTGGRRRRRR